MTGASAVTGETVQDAEATDPESAEEEDIREAEADTTAARKVREDTIAVRKAREGTIAARIVRDKARVNVLRIHQEKEAPADVDTKESKAPQGA